MSSGRGIDVFPTRSAAIIAQTTVVAVEAWIRARFIRPSILGSRGRGSRRAFSFRDVVALRVAVRLREHGVAGASVRVIVKYIQTRAGISATKPLAPIYLALRGGNVLELDDLTTLGSLRDPSMSPLTLVPLNEVVSEVQSAARQLRLEDPPSHMSENSLVKRAATRARPAA